MAENRLRGKYRFLPPDIPIKATRTWFRTILRGEADEHRPFPRPMLRTTKRRAGRRGWREYNKLVRLARKYGLRS